MKKCLFKRIWPEQQESVALEPWPNTFLPLSNSVWWKLHSRQVQPRTVGSLTPSFKLRAMAFSQKRQGSASSSPTTTCCRSSFLGQCRKWVWDSLLYSVSIHRGETLPQEQHIENMRAPITFPQAHSQGRVSKAGEASQEVQKLLLLPSTLQLKQGYHLERIAPLSAIPVTQSWFR